MTSKISERFVTVATLSEEMRAQNIPENDIWVENNASFTNYCEQSGLRGVEKTIRRQLGRIGCGAALDIAGGSDGKALQDLLGDGTVEKALLTNYYDTRSSYARSVGDLAHVAGDILDGSTWEQIEAWRTANAPEGFSLIMHRPFGALQHLPANIYQTATHELLDTLRPGGVLFMQIPLTLQPWLGGDLDSICTSLRNRNDIDKIYIPDFVQPLSGALVIKSAAL